MMAKRSGYLRTAATANSFEVGIPHHGVYQCAINAGVIHAGDCLVCRVGLLTMVGGRRTFLPEMDLSIDDQH